MNKLILTVLLGLYFFYTPAQTSVYHPFPDSNAVWNIYAMDICWFSSEYHNYYSITITGDTIIAGQNYKKLFTPDISIVNNSSCPGTILGIWNKSPGNISDHAYIEFTCFKQDNLILYPDTATVCDLIQLQLMKQKIH